jgi:hypothetical protein
MSQTSEAEANQYALTFRETVRGDILRSPAAAREALVSWVHRQLRSDPNVSTDRDRRFSDLAYGFRQCQLTEQCALLYRVDQKGMTVDLWMVDRPDDLELRIRNSRPCQTKGDKTFTTEWLDAIGIDWALWPLLVGKEQEPRAVLRLEAQLGGGLVSQLLQLIRPATAVEVGWSARREIANDRTLDELTLPELDLEHFLLVLDGDQRHVVNRFARARQRRIEASGPWLVKGGPGSGKSTALLYCVQEVLGGQQALFGSPLRILLTTYTRSLTESAKQLLQAWESDGAARVDCKNVNQLELQFAEKKYRDFEIVGKRSDQRDLVQQAMVAVGDPRVLETARTDNVESFVWDEIEYFICGRGLESAEKYANIQRHGRTTKLQIEQRDYIWKLHRWITDNLKETRRTTWTRLANHAFREVKRVGGKYDYVFVDEAQDLCPIDVRLCQALCKGGTNLFLTADANQSIYPRGFSWSSIVEDLSFRGRTTILRRNHRNAAEIAVAIRRLVTATTEPDEETVGGDTRVATGIKPTLLETAGTQPYGQSVRSIAEFIENGSINERVGFSCCAVLTPTRELGKEWARMLPKHMNATFFGEDKPIALNHPGVKVMTIHAAKGLQFPVVVVAGISRQSISWIGPREDFRSADDTRHRLLFVACSRAMRRLLLQVDSRDPVDVLGKGSPNREYWTVEQLPDGPR